MDSSSSTRIATHMPRGKVPNLNLKPTSCSEQGNDGKPPLSNVHYHSPRGTPLTPQTVLEDTATKAADERHVSVFEDSDQVFITINNCVRPIKEYLALEGSFFSTKYENGSQEFKDKVHRLIHLTEDFLRSFADKPQAANKTRLRELAFELAQILDLRDAEGWTQQTVEGARTAARHYTKPARDTNNLIAAVSAGSSIGIAGTALLGMPVVTGAAALALGVTTPFVFAYATLWQTKCHPTGLAGVAQQGPIFMPTVAPRNVIDWQGNSTPLRVSPDIKRDMALIEALLRSFEGAKATTRVINNKLRALNGEIKSIQEELAKKLLVADRAEFEDAIEKHKTEAVNALMFMSSKRGQRPDLYLKLLRLKKDREFCRSLLSDASWVRPPDGQHGTLHVGKKFLAKQNAQALTVGDPSHATKERLKAKLGSLRLDLLRSNLYLALNVQKQSDGRALRGGFNFGTAIFNLASAAAAYYDHLSPDDLPQNRVLGLHPSTLNLAGAAMTLTQAAVFNWTQPKLGTDDQLTRLSAMLQIKLLERGLRKNPFNPDLDNLLDALDERNPFDPKRLDAIAQGWGKVRCTHIGRILDFDRDCYILAIITHMLPPMKEETPSWTKPFKLTPGGEDTRIPATAEDFLVVLRKCKSDYREALIQQISPWALKKARNKIKRLLAVIQGLEKMAAEVKAMNVERMLLNGKIVVNEDKDQRLALLQPAARDIFEQSLLCARNKFLLTKGKQTHIEQPGGWTLSQLEEGDLALIQMRGMVDALTDGTAEPEFAQKAGQHHSYILFGAYSPQLIKALGFIFSGIAQMLSWEQAARIISMASSSTAMLSALLNFGLVYAYHKHIALKFAQQNRNQALGTVDVPNTGPWPFKSQFETLAAVPIREADLGSGDLNLQSDLSFFQDYLAQMQAAPIGGFKGRDGSWQLPFRNWMGYFSKKPEDLDELNPQEVETDLAKAFQEVLLEVKNIEEMEKKKLANIKRDAKHEHSDSDDGHHLIEVDEAVGDDSHDSGHSEDSTAQDTNAEAFDNFFDYNKKSTSSSSDNEGGHESHGGSYVDESNDDSSGSDDERRKNVAMASRFWNLRDEPTPDYVTKMPVDS